MWAKFVFQLCLNADIIQVASKIAKGHTLLRLGRKLILIANFGLADI